MRDSCPWTTPATRRSPARPAAICAVRCSGSALAARAGRGRARERCWRRQTGEPPAGPRRVRTHARRARSGRAASRARRGAPARRAAGLERRGARRVAGRRGFRSACSPSSRPPRATRSAGSPTSHTSTDEGVALYPQREALGEDEPHYEIAGERAETIEALLQGRLRVLVTTARATAERTLVPAALERLRLRLAPGERRPPGDVAAALGANGVPAGPDGDGGRRVQRARRHRRRVRLRHGGAGPARVVGRRHLVDPRVRSHHPALAPGAARGHGAPGRAPDARSARSRHQRAAGRDRAGRRRRAPHAARAAPLRHAHHRGGRRPRSRRGAAGLERGGAPPRGRPAAGRGRARAATPSWSRRTRGGAPARRSRGCSCATSGSTSSSASSRRRRSTAISTGSGRCSRARRRRSSSATTRASSSGSRSCWRRAPRRRPARRSRSARSTAAS